MTPSSEQALAFGPYRVYPGQRLILEGDQPLRLGSRALDILLVLLEHAGQVVSKQRLMSRVWPATVVEESNLRVHMAALRKALGDGQAGQRFIITVAQRGYSFVAPTASSAQAWAPSAPATPRQHNLPLRRARMIGRQPLVDSLLHSLNEQRLITLTGPGGIGKTSVALRVAEQSIGHYRDGIRLLDLSALSDPEQVVPRLASLLDLALDERDPMLQLSACLRERQMLLVIDNCEHLVDSIALLSEHLLRGAADLRILATSRESLRAEGEFIQRLDGLPCPPLPLHEPAQAHAFAALQLFAERAMSSQESFELDASTLARVCDICQRLDGIPLAIELAAAQVASLGLDGLQAQLRDNLGLLAQVHPDSHARHPTLYATLDWSFGLLDPNEQLCLRRLGVFKGRFNLKSAMAVIGEPVPADQVHTLLSQLVTKSLLHVDVGDDQLFYRLLDSTRRYALEQLRSQDELPATLERHAQRCLSLMRQAHQDWERLASRQWMQRYSAGLDDIREVLDWGLDGEGPRALAITLVSESTPLWQELSLLQEHGLYLSKALQHLADYPSCPRLEMNLKLALGSIRYHTRNSIAHSDRLFSEALQLADQCHDLKGQLRAISGLTAVSLCSGDYRAAAEHCQRFDHLSLGEDAALELSVRRLNVLALHFGGQLQPALLRAEEVLQHMAHSGTRNRFSHGFGIQYDQSVAALTILARSQWLAGQPDQAWRSARQALDVALQIEHGTSICYTLALAGCALALYTGRHQVARQMTEQLKEQAQRQGVRLFQSWAEHYAQVLDPSAQPGVPASGLIQDIVLTLAPCPVDAAQLARAQRGEAGWCSAEILRVHAATLAPEQAEPLLQQALSISREQGALAWELRSASALARLHAQRGDSEQAYHLLAPVYERFEEGHDTPDLLSARQLLNEW